MSSIYSASSSNDDTRSSRSSADEYGKDGILNYEILEQIFNGTLSSVYRARCKRGRLKNRFIALKKVPVERAHSLSSASLYQTLCHPSLVSLFSAFATSSHRYQVLELCSGGSLADFLRMHENHSISEGQTRTVIKAVLDGLVYLRKNSIVHRNIHHENILLTEQCRIKISNLDFATRLPSQDHIVIALLPHTEYVAPQVSFPLYSYFVMNNFCSEILSRRSYDCRADIWSLGCLVFTCLVGQPPFHGPSIDDMFENILQGRYSKPALISTLAGNFISNLIQVDPADRPDLPSITFDPFLDSRLPDLPLKQPSLPSQDSQTKIAKEHPIPFRAPSSLLKSKASIELTHKNARPPLREIQNSVLRRILTDETSFGDRRAVSDPCTKSDTVIGYSSRRHASLDIPSETQSTNRPGFYVSSSGSSRSSRSSDHDLEPEEACAQAIVNRACSDSEFSAEQLPIGTTRPSAFNTSLLSAQTHKTANGQITILPSRSLLVDFRQGERRRGNPGTEVFVVSPDGNKIDIFAAPRLSIPSCLTEPVSTYSVETLPREYWSLYNRAGTLTVRLKQRTPRCTLMANSPQADIELLLSDSEIRKDPQRQTGSSSDKDKFHMRLRYSRQMHHLGISQCVMGPQGKEWKKRTLEVSSLDLDSETMLTSLSSVEKEGLFRLLKFVRVCEAIEKEEEEEFDYRPEHEITLRAHAPSLEPNSLKPKDIPKTNRVVSNSRTLAQSLSVSSVDFKLAPRPPKFSSKLGRLSQNNLTSENEKQESREVDYSTKALSLTASDITPSWYRNGFSTSEITAPGQPLQTRFIPSAGWCIRYHSKVSQGGRYKVMFLDGEVLDIDVDEEWVEHLVPDSNGIPLKQRRSIRESHSLRSLSERMKVFDEFVSMFDAPNLSLQT
ncbi:kinase-like domain-containing protein [Lentinula raphanica]|nr:kinase-like domain-containing protein [Lentinula raphanica]